MHFIHPWFLTGLLAAAIPLLVQLLRHRRVKRVMFSSLEFLKLLHKKHSMRIRIDQTLLLLARIALAATLVLLFAQPFFSQPGLAFLNAGPRHVVVFFDNSGSMAAAGANGPSLFLQSLERLRKHIAGLSPRETLTVIALSPRARVAFRGKPEDFGSQSYPLQQAAAADVDGAVRLAETFFREGAGADRRLLVFSDFSAFPLTGLGALAAEAVLFPARLDGASNLSAGAISLDADKLAKGESVTLRVKVGRHGVARETQVTLSAAGKPVDRRTLVAGTGPAELVFTHRFEQAGLFPLTVSLDADAIAGDNQANALVEVLEQRRVVVVTGRALPEAQGVRDPLFFLRRALSGASPELSETPEKLEGASLSVLLRPDLLSERQGAAVLETVRRGGNLLLFLSPDEMDPAAANRNLFDQLGLVKVLRKVEGAAPWRATGSRVPVGLVDSRFWEGVSSSARFLLEPGKAFRRESVLVGFDDGTPAVLAAPLGRGMVSLINASPSVDGCDLPLHPIFPVFLSRLLAWTADRPSACLAGEEMAFSLPLEDFGDRLQVVAPGGKVFALTPERRGRQLAVTFQGAEQPGLYRFDRIAGDVRTSQHFVVRWPETESTLDYPTGPELLRQVPGARLAAASESGVWAGRLMASLQDLLLALVVMLMLAEAWLVFDLERQIKDVVDERID